MSDVLREFQLAELSILKSVTDAMEKNNIRYFLAYGTLLGAIRHKGFIPWDDDIDIFVPRPDYERFKDMADQILEKPLFLNYYEKESQSVFTNNLLHIENPNLQFWQEKGGIRIKQNIWIDIFPLDGMPASAIIQKTMFARFRFLYALLRLTRSTIVGVEENKKRPLIETVAIGINKRLKIGNIISYKQVLRRFDKIRMRYPYDTSPYVYGLTIDYMEKCLCKSEWFGKGKKAKFEDGMFYVPDNSDLVLKQFYGDYMKLPAEEDRVYKHSIGFVKDQS